MTSTDQHLQATARYQPSNERHAKADEARRQPTASRVRFTRTNGALAVVWDNRDPQPAVPAFACLVSPWVAQCLDHDATTSHATRTAAKAACYDTARWCAGCAAEAPSLLDGGKPYAQGMVRVVGQQTARQQAAADRVAQLVADMEAARQRAAAAAAASARPERAHRPIRKTAATAETVA